jgi:hypothetical protein
VDGCCGRLAAGDLPLCRSARSPGPVHLLLLLNVISISWDAAAFQHNSISILVAGIIPHFIKPVK